MIARRVMQFAALACLAAGCFKMNVNLNAGSDGGEGGSNPGGDAPSQLPASGGGSWKDIAIDTAGQIFTAAERGAIFYAYDTLAYPLEPVQLTARVQSAKTFRAIEEVTVGFYQDSALVGSAKTDKDGHASMEWTPPKAGDYQFTAKIVGVPDDDYEALLQITPAPLLVSARHKDTDFVVIDLDHTLVDSSFFRVLTGGAKPMAESVRVTKRIAERYSIIYLTHRPDLLTRKSKSWLKDNGYPAGPLLVSELKDAFGDSGKFKTAKLAAVRKSFKNIRIGIGDKPSDAQAYVDNGLVAYLIPDYKEKPKDLRKAASQIERLRDRDRLNVVSDWEQIEAGIFQTRKFPPKAFAAALKRQADQLDAEEQERKRREKEREEDD